MKRYVPSVIVSVAALVLALAHLVFPDVKIDAVTVMLMAIAILPWLGSIFKSIELPGGLKVEYPELGKIEEEAAKAGLLSAPEKKVEESVPTAAIAVQDPNLALAGLRIEIERRLREIAKQQGVATTRYGVRQLLNMLQAQSAISPQEASVLNELIVILNKAVHGAEVDSRAAQWAAEVGPQILSALDRRISGKA